MKTSSTEWCNSFPVSRLLAAAILLFVFLVSAANPVFAQKITTGANMYSSYTIDANGALYTWGRNTNGQLGHGNTTNYLLPDTVSYPSGVTSWIVVASGQYHTLAIGSDGNIYASGNNSHGELGDGTTTSSSIPVMVSKPGGVTSWMAVACGNDNSYAIGSDGNAYAGL